MTQLTKTIHFCPDEWALLLEALHSYKDTNDGRRVAGRLNWVRANWKTDAEIARSKLAKEKAPLCFLLLFNPSLVIMNHNQPVRLY